MQAAPRILVTWSRRATRPPDLYLQAVRAAGGLPVLLPAPAGVAPLHETQGLLLAGGRDVDPPLYGQAPDPRVVETLDIDRERDEMELALIAAALERALPVLGICRGIQVLNVALGGTLVQDLSLRGLDAAAHQQRRRQPEPPEWAPVHDVRLEADSRLARLLGAPAVGVNSFHHQAVDEVAPGLRATGRAPDGVVEGLESADDRFIVGVQWHPERMGDATPQRALIAALVDAARGRGS